MYEYNYTSNSRTTVENGQTGCFELGHTLVQIEWPLNWPFFFSGSEPAGS